MPSTLTWIDHDSVARERTLRILVLFQERESRDELGIGAIRDSFADRLFPGTSTIQTRLRYMLFVAWIYKSLEDKQVPPSMFAEKADRMERSLVTPLLATEDRTGVFGKTAGSALKRLPSSVYWSGLGSWGIRLIEFSRDEYHRGIGFIHNHRAEYEAQLQTLRNRSDDLDFTPPTSVLTWHPRLPDKPDDFPERASFALTNEEASFLLDCIHRSHPDSLLAYLSRNCDPVDVSAPWLHPQKADFTIEHNEIIEYARLFSDLMHGASILYNVALSEQRGWNEKTEFHKALFESWSHSFDLNGFKKWSLTRLWELTAGQSHNITYATRRFVANWERMVLEKLNNLHKSSDARELIRSREIQLKKYRSRFKNRRALEQWGGASGLNRLVYRWPNVQIILRDLYDGFNRRVH